nr:sulfate transporter-like isoform X2 [Procambarus clarkii]
MARRDEALDRQGMRRLLARDVGASSSRESGIDAGDAASSCSYSSSRAGDVARSCSYSSSRESGLELSVTQDVLVGRPSLNVKDRASKCHYSPPHNPGIFESIQSKAKESCTCSGSCWMSAVTSKVPILSWLPSYGLRASLMGDVVAGITVAIMHIPQGMASAVLGGLPPITGIYMAFFPVLVYACLGTSRHCSVGTFAVVMQMTGKLVEDFSTEESSDQDSSTENGTETPTTLPPDASVNESVSTTYSPNQVAAVLALTTGIVEVLLGLLQLGTLCVFLSDMLVSGFTTGASFHVLTSQIKNLFGIKVRRYSGPFKLIYTYRDIFSNLTSSNPSTMLISSITISLLVLNNEVLKPWVSKRSKIPIPIELIVVVIGTLTSYLMDFHRIYNVRIVGKIPTGLPEARVPPVALMSQVAVDAGVISVVSYIVSFSMAKILAKRKNYNVDATQELYALGMSNIFGSFFGCGPVASSFARTLIQESAGGVTQMASFVSCSVLVFVLLFVGPLFETLPYTVEIPAVVMFQFRGPLHFANSEYFRNQLVEVTGLDPFTIATSRCAILKERMLEENVNIQLTHKDPIGMASTRSLMVEQTLRLTNTQIMSKTKQVSLTLPEVDWLVVEMSGVGYIDSSAGRLLSQLSKEYKKAGITLCLAAPSENVLETLEVCGTLKVIPQEHIFHSAHDAVMSLSHPSTPVAVESSTQL